MEVHLTLRWQIAGKPAEELPEDLIKLLDGIARGGKLRFAAAEAKLSYRHAWGMIKHWEQRLGAVLVTLEQGRGAGLTRAGEALRDLWVRTTDRTAAPLTEAAAHVSRHLSALAVAADADAGVLRIAASHGFGIATLAGLMRSAKLPLELQILGSEESLKRYAAGECQVAGFHVPLGKHGTQLWSHFQRYLDSRRDILVMVETRELGFMARPGAARVGIKDIAARKLRLQNRQVGAGSRLVFDLLLAEAGLTPDAIDGYYNEEYTHVAVAAVIASGEADVGFGARAAAEKFGLAFWPEVTEKYLLVLSREAIGTKPLSEIPRLLAGTAYQRDLNKVPGCDARGAGRRVELKALPAVLRRVNPRQPGNREALIPDPR